MDFSPILFTALTLLSSCTLTALATPAEGLSTSPIEDGPLPNIVLFAMAEIKDDANPVDQHNATATPSALSSAVTRGAGSCVDVNKLNHTQKSHDTDKPLQRSTVHDDTDIGIIWHNLHADSDFTVFRKKSDGFCARGGCRCLRRGCQR